MILMAKKAHKTGRNIAHQNPLLFRP